MTGAYKGSLSLLIIIVIAILCAAVVIIIITSGTDFLEAAKNTLENIPVFKTP